MSTIVNLGDITNALVSLVNDASHSLPALKAIPQFESNGK
jgi:hypothetical protein